MTRGCGLKLWLLLVRCAEGYLHRASPVACEVVEPSAPSGEIAAGGATGSGQCDDDAQCSDLRLGYCDYDGGLGDCASGCASDADCAVGQVCSCYGPSPHGGRCEPASCVTDADCAAGWLCVPHYGACGDSGFACAQADDDCLSDADCPNGERCYWEPVPYGGGTNIARDKRVCENAICGRPFLVDSSSRVAAICEARDWRDLAAALPDTARLNAAERRAQAEHWTRMGQMEHASIAAFARFSLQLLALGAPPELVEGCTAALADETAHAKLCFALASAYAGHDIGPGPLDISNSLAHATLTDVVDLVLAEGCFGETSAALEALELADAATDPVVFDVYSRIARDEQRHAELAFRFVRWALEQDPRIAERVQHALINGPMVSSAVQDVVESCLYGVLSRRYAA
jgi:hypothetical protein